MSKKAHFMSVAVQDLRTSSIRKRAKRLARPELWLFYLEALWALHEAGGELPAGPEAIADEVEFWTPEQVAEMLPLVAPSPGKRGGIVVDGDVIRNVRVTEDLGHIQELRETKARAGQASVAVRKRRYGTARPVKVDSIAAEQDTNAPQTDTEQNVNTPRTDLNRCSSDTEHMFTPQRTRAERSQKPAEPSVSVSYSDSVPDSGSNSDPDSLRKTPSVAVASGGVRPTSTDATPHAATEGPGPVARGAFNGCLDHDPDDPVEAELALLCWETAQRLAHAEGRTEATEADRLDALEAASEIKNPKQGQQPSLLYVLGATQGWLRASIRQIREHADEWVEDRAVKRRDADEGVEPEARPP